MGPKDSIDMETMTITLHPVAIQVQLKDAPVGARFRFTMKFDRIAAGVGYREKPQQPDDTPVLVKTGDSSFIQEGQPDRTYRKTGKTPVWRLMEGA